MSPETPAAPKKSGKGRKIALGVGAGFFALIVIGAVAGGGSEETTPPAEAAPTLTQEAAPAPTVTVTAEAPAAPVESAAPVVAEAAVAAPAPATESIADGQWTLDKVQFDGGALGLTSGSARITNHGGAASSASFSVAIEGSDGSFGTLTGFASDVTAGDTLTVSLLGSDEVVDPKATDLKVTAF